MNKKSLIFLALIIMHANFIFATAIIEINTRQISAMLDGEDAKKLYEILNATPTPIAKGFNKKFHINNSGYSGPYGSLDICCSTDTKVYNCTVNLNALIDDLIEGNGFLNFIGENYPAHAVESFQKVVSEGSFMSSDENFSIGCIDKQCYVAMAVIRQAR